MKNSINRFGLRAFLFFFMLCVNPVLDTQQQVFAQDLTDVADGLEDTRDDVIDIADVIITVFLVISFVFMIITFVTNSSNQKTAVLTFVGVLILYSLFQVIFN